MRVCLNNTQELTRKKKRKTIFNKCTKKISQKEKFKEKIKIEKRKFVCLNDRPPRSIKKVKIKLRNAAEGNFFFFIVSVCAAWSAQRGNFQ